MGPVVDTSPLRCDLCDAVLPEDAVNRPEPVACPRCRAPARVHVFRALFEAIEAGATPQALLLDDESSCFYHPKKKALLPCDHCGRFLCALCEIEIHGRHFCPGCVEQGTGDGEMKELRPEYVHYDSIALGLAVLPIFFFWPTLFTAPAALYFAIRYWKRPLSILPRRRWRFLVAALIASIQIAGWGFLVAVIVTGIFE